MKNLIHSLYNLGIGLITPWFRKKLYKRAQLEPGYGYQLEERFGKYDSTPTSELLWIHAVSLGETRAAGVLMDAIRELRPKQRFLLTHGTATGREAGRALLQTGDIQVWQPWDTPPVVRAFIRQFRPQLCVLMETEIWPNLITECRRRNIPVALVNARMNPKTFRRSARLRWLSEPLYKSLRLVLAQTEADAEKIRQLGAQVQAVLGNIKFDQSADPVQLDAAKTWRTQRMARSGAGLRPPVVMLASSREGEEILLLQVLKAQPELMQRAQWMLVPRHPQRFDEVAQLIQSQGHRLQRRSEIPARGFADATDGSASIWLGDSMGEMAWYYGIADVCLLGGSFLPLGGQNLIEACACACPVIMGPHTFNFADASEKAIAARAARRVASMEEAMLMVTQLCAQSHELLEARQAARAFSRSEQGVARETAVRLVELLPQISGA